MALEDRTALALGAVRIPSLLVPSFVTPDFLRRFMPLTNRDLRMIHDRYGATINELTGIAWPKEKPSLEEFYELLPEALSYPAFVLLFGLYIPGEVRKRGRGPMPQQLGNRFISVLMENTDLLEDRAGSGFYPVSHPYFISAFLNEGGDLEIAVGAYFIYALSAGWVRSQTLMRWSKPASQALPFVTRLRAVGLRWDMAGLSAGILTPFSVMVAAPICTARR